MEHCDMNVFCIWYGCQEKCTSGYTRTIYCLNILVASSLVIAWGNKFVILRCVLRLSSGPKLFCLMKWNIELAMSSNNCLWSILVSFPCMKTRKNLSIHKPYNWMNYLIMMILKLKRYCFSWSVTCRILFSTYF